MASGNTTTDALEDSINIIVASARQVREYEGVVPQLVERHTLDEGRSWKEVAFDQLVAMAVSEGVEWNNPQLLSDSAINITPTTIVIYTVLTDEVAKTISAKSYAQIGSLAQNAMQRKKDEDGLAQLDAATTSLSGAGSTLASGVIAAAGTRITSNVTEGATGPIYAVLHGYQIKDIWDELVAGVGTYPIPVGDTATVFKEGFRGAINGVKIYEDGNITIDSSDDAKGGVFAKMGMLLIEQAVLEKEVERLPRLGSGATGIILRDRYAYGERSAGHWVYEIYSDATVPTS
jgi:hypothetical protein